MRATGKPVPRRSDCVLAACCYEQRNLREKMIRAVKNKRLPDNERCPHCGGQMSRTKLVELIINSYEDVLQVAWIKFHLEDRISMTDKQLFNALGSLVRRKRVRRVGYGEYQKVKTA